MARPTVMTAETIAKLEQAFSFGCNDTEACHYAGIGDRTLYDYQKAHPEFSQRKEALKDNPVLLAKKNVLDAVIEGDRNMSTWLLERKRKDEYSTKTTTDNNHNINLGEALSEFSRKARAGETSQAVE